MDLEDKIKLWVSEQLREMGRGAKARLAEHLDVTPTQVTKMLNTGAGKEHRVIRADELVKIVEFFGEFPKDLIQYSDNDDGKRQLVSTLKISFLKRIVSLCKVEYAKFIS